MIERPPQELPRSASHPSTGDEPGTARMAAEELPRSASHRAGPSSEDEAGTVRMAPKERPHAAGPSPADEPGTVRMPAEAALGPNHPSTGISHNNLANALNAQRKYAEAEAEYRAALAIFEAAYGPEHPTTAIARTNLAIVLLNLNRPAEALPLAELGWARRQKDDIPQEERGETAFTVARSLWSVEGRARDRRRARQLAEEALISYTQAGEAHAESLAEVQAWLKTHK